jgi:hypothetical protein
MVERLTLTREELEAAMEYARAGAALRRILACTEVPMPDKLVVHNPTGYPPKVTGKALAPRLDSLNGKTVYLVDCRFDDSDVFLMQLKGWFNDHMPAVKPVFKPINSVYTVDDPVTWQEIKQNGDAAIIGVGH